MFISNLISATCFKNPKSTKDCFKKNNNTQLVECFTTYEIKLSWMLYPKI